MQRLGWGIVLLVLSVVWHCADSAKHRPEVLEEAVQHGGEQSPEERAHYDPQQLVRVLPQQLMSEIEGVEVTPPVVGTEQGEQYEWTSVHRDYWFPNKGTLSITVKDFVNRAEFLSLYPQFFRRAEQIDANTWRQQQWDQRQRSGRLFVWAKDRLGIEIEAKQLPPSLGTLWAIYQRYIAARIDSLVRTTQ